MRTDRLSGIGVLYESDEWSDHKLAAELAAALAEMCGDDAPVVTMIDMTRGDCVERALACGMLVSRVFASARFRGHDAALRAARALGIGFGSFDVIETRHGAYFIDANSVSNVSEDCTELFGFDLMRAHARGMARRYCQMRSGPPEKGEMPC